VSVLFFKGFFFPGSLLWWAKSVLVEDGLNPEKEGAILLKGLSPSEIGLLYLFVVSDLLNAAADDGLSRAGLGIWRGF